LQLIWGKQDQHVHDEGRMKIHLNLITSKNNFSWHAFMRDEGERYDPALALRVYGMAVELFQRTL
jgi:carboxymethylenebutenolidase